MADIELVAQVTIMTRLTHLYGPAVRCKRFHRPGWCGLALLYPASDWSVCSGPSWISARMWP